MEAVIKRISLLFFTTKSQRHEEHFELKVRKLKIKDSELLIF
jgi:hypothetical protein